MSLVDYPWECLCAILDIQIPGVKLSFSSFSRQHKGLWGKNGGKLPLDKDRLLRVIQH